MSQKHPTQTVIETFHFNYFDSGLGVHRDVPPEPVFSLCHLVVLSPPPLTWWVNPVEKEKGQIAFGVT